MSDKLISAMQNITRVLWSAAALLAPWLVPIGSAILFGWAMRAAALTLQLPPALAGVVGVATACGLETVNIAAAHAAIALSHDRKHNAGRFALACALIAFYVILGIGAMLTLPVRPEVHAIGAAMFLLTPVAITAQALALDIGQARQEGEARQARDEERRRLAAEREREQQDLRAQELALEFDRLRTERALANAQVRLARAQAASVGQMSGAPPTGDRRWRDKAAFLSDTGRPVDISVRQLAEMADISERTAFRWLTAARNLNGNKGE